MFAGRVDLTEEVMGKFNIQDFSEDVMAHAAFKKATCDLESVLEQPDRLPTAVRGGVLVWYNRLLIENGKPLIRDISGIVLDIATRRRAADKNIFGTAGRHLHLCDSACSICMDRSSSAIRKKKDRP